MNLQFEQKKTKKELSRNLNIVYSRRLKRNYMQLLATYMYSVLQYKIRSISLGILFWKWKSCSITSVVEINMLVVSSFIASCNSKLNHMSLFFLNRKENEKKTVVVKQKKIC